MLLMKWLLNNSKKNFFQEIPTFISKVLESHMENLNLSPELEDILEVDNWARLLLSKKLKKEKIRKYWIKVNIKTSKTINLFTPFL